MYFFIPLHQKGKNAERKVPAGFWKRTRNIDLIKGEDGNPIAQKTSLAYYKKDPASESAMKGQWLMTEYMLVGSDKMVG